MSAAGGGAVKLLCWTGAACVGACASVCACSGVARPGKRTTFDDAGGVMVCSGAAASSATCGLSTSASLGSRCERAGDASASLSADDGDVAAPAAASLLVLALALALAACGSDEPLSDAMNRASSAGGAAGSSRCGSRFGFVSGLVSVLAFALATPRVSSCASSSRSSVDERASCSHGGVCDGASVCCNRLAKIPNGVRASGGATCVVGATGGATVDAKADDGSATAVRAGASAAGCVAGVIDAACWNAGAEGTAWSVSAPAGV